VTEDEIVNRLYDAALVCAPDERLTWYRGMLQVELRLSRRQRHVRCWLMTEGLRRSDAFDLIGMEVARMRAVLQRKLEPATSDEWLPIEYRQAEPRPYWDQ
jgi:hypothetical protein